jgi:predicted RND superfamily exporter protein
MRIPSPDLKSIGGRLNRLARMGRPSAVWSGVKSVWPAFRSWISPRRAVALLVLLAVSVVLVLGLARSRVETGLDSFLPSGDPALAELDRVGRAFGGDPVVVLLESAQPRTLLGEKVVPDLVKLEGELAHLPDVAAVYGPGTVLNQVTGRTQDVLIEMIGRRDGDADQAYAQAKASGAGEAAAVEARESSLAQFNQRYGALLLQGMPSGLPTLRNPAFVERLVFAEGDIGRSGPKAQWRFVVPSENSVAILVRPREGSDATAITQLVNGVRAAVDAAKLPASRVTVSGVPAVVSALSAQVSHEGPLLGGVALLAVGGCFLLVPWTRRSRRLVPLLTTVTAIGALLSAFGWLHRPLSIGVVAFLPVVLGIGCYYPTYFAVRANTRTVLTVACATAASFATLVISPLPLVRDLGLTLSIGVLLAAVLGVLARRLISTAPDLDTADLDPVGLDGAASGDSDVTDTATPGLKEMAARRGPVLAFMTAVLVAGVGWTMLPGLPLQTDVQGFAAGLPALDDARHVERTIGSSGEIDIALSGDNVLSPEAIEWMDRAEELVITQHGDQMRRVVSMPMLLSFLGNTPTPDQVESAMRLLPPYLTEAAVDQTHRIGILSFGVKLDDLAGTQALRDDLRRILPQALAGYQVTVTGLPIVAVRGQELVSADRLRSNLLGVFAASGVLAIGLRRRSDAARAMASAALATGGGLFVLWLTGTPLSPITVALGSLTAAVGCEFTVLLTEAGRRRNPALRRAVLLVTATSVLGYAVLVVSGIAVVREFGVLLAGAVLLALLSSLCVVRLTSGASQPPKAAGYPAQSPPKSLLGVKP